MFGRMQFADYVVSYALQSLARSLLRVRDHDGELQCSDEKSLAETAARLLSLWQMMQWSVGKLQYERAQHDLREVVLLCAPPGDAVCRGARALLELAEARDRPLIEEVSAAFVRAETSPLAAQEVKDRLSLLLQQESARWREGTALRQISDTDLIEHGICRAFAKSLSLNGKLYGRSDVELPRRSPSYKRLLRMERWMAHCANHLELLRPALSDVGRARRWHVNRLLAKLEAQKDLAEFARRASVISHQGQRPAKAAVRLDALIAGQRRRLEKQHRKLGQGAFAGGRDAFRRETEEAVRQLGLSEITLMPLETARENATPA